jgi:hypothetical protein
MENSQLRFNRELCDDCSRQPDCKIGRFADGFVLFAIEPETSATMIEPVVDLYRPGIYDGIHSRDRKLFKAALKAQNDEYVRVFDRNEHLNSRFENLLEIIFNAGEQPSLKTTELMLENTRAQFLKDTKISDNFVPTLKDLVEMATDVKLWRDDDICIQSLAA